MIDSSTTEVLIDGRQGEGGGQIVRTSLSLAALTGRVLKLVNVRGGRGKPGLLRQHLTAVRAMAEICDATVEGDQLGSSSLTFAATQIRGGDYEFEVGSAGSAILVAQTILPALMAADRPSTVTIGGGTHAPWAPPYEFLEHCYLPLLRRMGATAECQIDSQGFYPAGGGKIVLSVEPSLFSDGLQLCDRGTLFATKVTGLVSKIPLSIAERECDLIRRKTGWNADQFRVMETKRSGGPGNVVMIQLDHEHLSELFVGFGKVGVRAEQIARAVLRETRQYLSHTAPVGKYLADQLLLPMGWAAAGGHSSCLITPTLSQHSLTQISVLESFLEIQILATEAGDGMVQVSTSPRKRAQG